MTKTYDLVTLYYKGHSPLKKEDNSFLLCLYTMLFVLFAMVIVLLLCAFYNVETVEKESIYVHNEPQQQKKTVISTAKPVSTPRARPNKPRQQTVSIPKARPWDYNSYYEETAKPIINWDNVVDFFVGSEEVREDTKTNHPIRTPSQRTPVWNEAHQRSELEPNQLTTAIRSAKEDNLNPAPSVPSPIQEHAIQESKFDLENVSNTAKSKQKSSVPSPLKEHTTQVSVFGLEDSNEATKTPKSFSVADNINKGSKFNEQFNNTTNIPNEPPGSSQIPENTNQPSELYIQDFTSTTKAPQGYISSSDISSVPTDVTKESTSIIEDVTVTTQTPKDTNLPSAEENFNEWPEEVVEGITNRLPLEKNLNEEVEWVPDLQNPTSGNKTGHFETQKDCTSSRCEVAASKMISSINLSVEPCRNFYSFACGGVSLNRGKMDPELFLDDSLPDSDFVKKFKQLYKSCLEHENYLDYRDRIQRTKRVLSDIGMFTFDGEQSNKDVTDVFASLIMLDAMPLFNIDVDITDSTFILKMLPPDRTLSSKYWSPLAETRKNCLRTTQPETYHPPLDITFLYYDYQECQENHKDYLKSLETSVEELGYFGNLNDTQRKLYIKNTVEFVQKNLLPILDSAIIAKDKIVNLEYNNMNIEDFKEQFPIIDWSKFFKVISSNEINSTSSVQVYNKAYFDILFKKLSSFNKERLFNGLNAVLTEKYYQEVVLPTPKHSRAIYCSKLSRKLLPDISNYLYQKFEVTEDFEERKKYINSLFHNMKQEFQDSLQDLDWLDESSRISIGNKISNLKLEMSQDNLDIESIHLEEVYSKLDLDKRDYSVNYYEATKFRRKTFLSLHGKPANARDIFRNLVDNLREDPVFFYGHNSVCIPDGLVHKTYMDFPKYLIVAKIGFPLAKIIGHAVDPVGLKFGVNLSPNVSLIYDRFVQENIRSLPHHLAFKKLDLVFSLNSQISEMERIAENTAMGLVTNSIREIQSQRLLPWISYTFSREKIFFMALVQEFCTDMSLMEFVVQAHENGVLPPQFRVQNILENSETFHAQFSCRPSGKTNRLQFPYLSVLATKDLDKVT